MLSAAWKWFPSRRRWASSQLASSCCSNRAAWHAAKLPRGTGAVSALVSGKQTGLFAVAGHDPIAQNLVGLLDCVGVDDEVLLTGVLGDEFQAELKVLEPGGAEIADGLALLQGLLYQQFSGGLDRKSVV